MYAEIIPLRRLPLALASLTYLVPPSLQALIQPGQLVAIPFLSRTLYGIVKSVATADAPTTATRLRPISALVSPTPLIGEAYFQFLEQTSTRYRVPLGWLLKESLPPLGARAAKMLALSFKVQPPLPLLSVTPPPRRATYRTPQEKQVLLTALNKNHPGQKLWLVPELTDLKALRQLLPKNHRLPTHLISGATGASAWRQALLSALQGKPGLYLGTRRALLMPFRRLSLIVVDDEGHSAHKNFDAAPRWHTRDAAELLSAAFRAPLYYISHTPSVETYGRIKYQPISWLPAKKPGPNYSQPQSLGPAPVIINLNDERRAGNTGIISDYLWQAVKKSAKNVFLCLNRRGSYQAQSCRDCGEIARCKSCAHPLTYHEDIKELRCHTCGLSEPVSNRCPRCGGLSTKLWGVGTKQAQKELQQALPAEGLAASVLRLDSDALPLKQFPRGRSIIIGTQFAWSRIPWSQLGVMAWLDPDLLLSLPEYRATEELWQRLRSAAFRLPKDAEFIIQTKIPEHFIFQALWEPSIFYRQELEFRKRFLYPPQSLLLKLWTDNQNTAALRAQGHRLYQELKGLTKARGLGTIAEPIFLPLETTAKRRAVLLLQMPPDSSDQTIKAVLRPVPELWKVDWNPQSIFNL